MAKEEEIPQPAEKPESETPAEQEAAFEQPESETPAEKDVSAEKVESETPAKKEVGAEQKVEAKEPEIVQEAKAGEEIGKDARMWAMICHLGGLGGLIPVVPIIGSVIAPLIIWQVKKDQDPFINEQGKEALNFQISVLIYALVSGLLCFACIGFFLLPAVYIFDLIFLLIAAVKTNDGKHYRYPLTIRFVK
jgi:uncharacterized Tic20 family protein